jgi:hypothetical protein
MNTAKPIFNSANFRCPGTYWEKRIVQWQVVADDNGNLWKLDGEEVVDILDSGVDDVDGLSDCWQIMNY